MRVNLLNYYTLCCLLSTIIATHIQLKTKQGIVYGRKTERSIEYLG